MRSSPYLHAEVAHPFVGASGGALLIHSFAGLAPVAVRGEGHSSRHCYPCPHAVVGLQIVHVIMGCSKRRAYGEVIRLAGLFAMVQLLL